MKKQCIDCGVEICDYATRCRSCCRKGELNPFKGKHHLQETKDFIRKNNSGVKVPLERVERMRAKLIGRKITWGDKISKAKTGKHQSEEHIKNALASRRKTAEKRGYYYTEETKHKFGENRVRYLNSLSLDEKQNMYDKISKAVTKLDKELIKKLYLEENSSCDIAEQLNCSASQVWKILKDLGVPIRKEITEKSRLKMIKSRANRKYSDATRKKMSIARIGKYCLDKHPRWIDGRSFEPYPITFTKEFKNLVRLRDNFCCLNCGISEQKNLILFNQKLHTHHIDHDKKNTCLANCCALCIKCNSLANKNINEWQEYYQEKLSKLYGYQYERDKMVIQLNQEHQVP